jgi:hypothetical protein
VGTESTALKIIQLNTRRAEGVRSEWKTVTPEVAEKWLLGNTHNRKVKDAAVARYAADMLNGRWRQTHQGIAFDEENRLIDGQHRLLAVIEAQTNIVMQVTYGLPMTSQAVVDDGVPRSVVDIARWSGDDMVAVTRMHAAVANRMLHGMSGSNDVRTLTRQERVEFLRKHWKAVDFTVSLFPTRKVIRGVMNAGTLGAIGRAFYHEDHGRLRRFSEVLVDGVNRDERDRHALALREYLLRRGITRGGANAVAAYAKTQRALKNFCKGAPVGRNLVPVTEDLYPLPKVRALLTS